MKSSKDRKCFLIWEGVISNPAAIVNPNLAKKKTFEKWRVVDVRSENEARRLLGEKGCDHFWHMAMTF